MLLNENQILRAYISILVVRVVHYNLSKTNDSSQRVQNFIDLNENIPYFLNFSHRHVGKI